MLNPLDMTGRRVLVTGASSGIGRETAIILSRLGAAIILVARNLERLEETLGRLDGAGHAIEVRDLSIYEDIPSWMRECATRHGPMDGLVHCAGLHLCVPVKVMAAADVETLWQTNVSASLWLAKAYRQRGVNNSGGSLVFLASAAGLVGQAGHSAYSASKGAVVAMARSLAMEFVGEKIRVNCVAPGWVSSMSAEFAGGPTEEQLAAIRSMHPLGFGEAADVAYAVAYLLCPASKWVTGTVLAVDGGYTCH
jgi:NAD(P)-dependent dehydrogenase (short-subunit alcohol dehydrogenase family)